jgi:uncharacterized lipoprotein YajG
MKSLSKKLKIMDNVQLPEACSNNEVTPTVTPDQTPTSKDRSGNSSCVGMSTKATRPEGSQRH